MSVEAILMHFETIFACEIRLIVQAFHVAVFKPVSKPPLKNEQLFRPLDSGIKINIYKKQRLVLIQISFHWTCLAKRTLQKFESRRFVGNARYIHDNRRINMHARFIAYLRIVRKAVFENFIRKWFVGMLFNSSNN